MKNGNKKSCRGPQVGEKKNDFFLLSIHIRAGFAESENNAVAALRKFFVSDELFAFLSLRTYVRSLYVLRIYTVRVDVHTCLVHALARCGGCSLIESPRERLMLSIALV